MKAVALAVFTAAVIAVLACKKPLPAAPRPDYDGAKSNSERSFKSLDKETAD